MHTVSQGERALSAAVNSNNVGIGRLRGVLPTDNQEDSLLAEPQHESVSPATAAVLDGLRKAGRPAQTPRNLQ